MISQFGSLVGVVSRNDARGNLAPSRDRDDHFGIDVWRHLRRDCQDARPDRDRMHDGATVRVDAQIDPRLAACAVGAAWMIILPQGCVCGRPVVSAGPWYAIHWAIPLGQDEWRKHGALHRS
jgi:hypothetical protein